MSRNLGDSTLSSNSTGLLAPKVDAKTKKSFGKSRLPKTVFIADKAESTNSASSNTTKLRIGKQVSEPSDERRTSDDKSPAQHRKKKQRNKILEVKDAAEHRDYSEGESGSEFVVKFEDLKAKQKINRVIFIWMKAFSRARAAFRIKQVFLAIHNESIQGGSTRNIMQSNVEFTKRSLDMNRKCRPLRQDSYFKTFWSIVLLIIISYTAVYVPYKLAFIEEDTLTISIIDNIVDGLFWIDLAVNFLSEYDDPVTLQPVSDFPKIIVNYLTSWFMFDLLAAFPFGAFQPLIVGETDGD